MAEDLIAAVVLLGALLGTPGIGRWIRATWRAGKRACLAADGVQEVEIVVQGRYRPDTVVVIRDVPARLLFNRQEDVSCSERVIFSDSHQERWLAPFTTTAVQFIPSQSGEFLFTCAMGMYQGRLIVEDPRPVGRVGRLRREAGRRCAVCGATVTGAGVERHGRHFCNEWHAARYSPRKSLWRRLWEGGDRSAGGGGCCR